MKRSLWLIAILTIIGWTASAQPLIEESIRSQAQAAIKAGAFPSLVIGVEQDGRSEIAGFGEGNPDGRTIYEIGSVTKTFTALLLADAVVRSLRFRALRAEVHGDLIMFSLDRVIERRLALVVARFEIRLALDE